MDFQIIFCVKTPFIYPSQHKEKQSPILESILAVALFDFKFKYL